MITSGANALIRSTNRLRSAACNFPFWSHSATMPACQPSAASAIGLVHQTTRASDGTSLMPSEPRLQWSLRAARSRDAPWPDIAQEIDLAREQIVVIQIIVGRHNIMIEVLDAGGDCLFPLLFPWRLRRTLLVTDPVNQEDFHMAQTVNGFCFSNA